MMMRSGLVKMKIVPVPIRKMDAKHVCATRMEMPPGAMELEVFTMMFTLRNMERTHLVIAIGLTGNAIQIFLDIIFLAKYTIGSVKVDYSVVSGYMVVVIQTVV